MKKYRRTKITFRTREVISLTSSAPHVDGEATHNPVCPLCHAPLGLPPEAKIFAAETTRHDCPKPENK